LGVPDAASHLLPITELIMSDRRAGHLGGDDLRRSTGFSFCELGKDRTVASARDARSGERAAPNALRRPNTRRPVDNNRNDAMLRLLDPLRTVDAVRASDLMGSSGQGEDLLGQAVEADYIRRTETAEAGGETSYALTQSGRDFLAQHTDGPKEI
jgi:hypothetical protein